MPVKEPMDWRSPDAPPAETAPAFWNEAESLGRALLGCLEYFEALGIERLPVHLAPPARRPEGRPPQAVLPAGAAGAERRLNRPAPDSAGPRKSAGQADLPGREKGGPESWAAAAKGLADLEGFIGQCRACPLGQGAAAGPVPGRGSPRPLMAVVGPTPAIYEGQSGELLTAMIEKGLKLSPADYYLTSLVKCPPPVEPPDLDRADAVCRPFLLRQLAFLAPKIVLALGKKPGQRLSGLAGEPLGLLRLKSHKIPGLDGVWLRITYGLEDILASQKIKEAAWQDLLRMRPGLQKLKTSGPKTESGPDTGEKAS